VGLDKERKIMKQSKLAPRNPLVAVALFKKAGEHRKPGKALRRQDKMSLMKAARHGGESAAGSRRDAVSQLRTSHLALR
jgi:hypothetical protein